MLKSALWESIHLGHFHLNGLSRSNYATVFSFCGLFVGRATERVEQLFTDGDLWLVDAVEAAIAPGGSFGSGAPASHGLCRFHAIKISSQEMMAKHGFNTEERDLAYDIKDRIYTLFRTCETSGELESAHLALCTHIEAGTIPRGLSLGSDSIFCLLIVSVRQPWTDRLWFIVLPSI